MIRYFMTVTLSYLFLCLPASAQMQTNPPATSAQTQAGTPLTLQEAEAISLKNNPQITIGKLRALEAWQYVREARSALLPTASLNLTGVTTENNTRITAGFLNNPSVFQRAAGGTTLSQLLTDFGRTTNLVSSSELQAKAEDQNAAATRADIVLAVDQSFYSALETKALVQVAQSTVETRQALVERVQALTRAKLKSDLDLSFAQVDLARAKLLLLEAENNYQASLAGLSAILGYPDEQSFEVTEEAQAIAPPVSDVQPLILQALQQRPEIAALQFEVQSAAKNASAEHDLWRPTISALGVAGVTPVRDDRILTSWYGAVGVNVNIPIFNGFLFNARAKAADLQTEVNRQKLLDMRNNVARDVRIAWQDTNRAYQRLSVTQQMLEQANLAMSLGQQRYNLGLGSIVELSQAELGKAEADIADTDAKYQYHLTQIVLAFTMAKSK